MKLVFYPVFDDAAALTDHFYRLHWYFHPFRDRISEIVLARSAPEVEVGAVPEYLDPGLRALAGGLPISLKTISQPDALTADLQDADCVLVWSTADNRPNPPHPALRGKPMIRIDHNNERFAASFYLKFAERFEDLQANYLARSKTVFERIRKRCASETGYIFGTGPGLAQASEHDFSDGVSIACNSMVKNKELLDRLKPPLIVIADPIFHAGCSTYAATFRQELVKALDRYDADLIVPLRDYHIYSSYLPSRFADRIAAIPFQQGEAPNLDLAKEFHVTSTGNVLTLFLIPLAATLFEGIRIFGCDGRPPEANKYFWSHDKASQFNDRMEDIKKAHPAFFAIDYDDYYQTHCSTLETWLTAVESLGKRVSNNTHSYIPALARRTAPTPSGPSPKRTLSDCEEVVSLDPDALGNFGHYLSYDERIGEEVKRRKIKYSVFGHRDFASERAGLGFPVDKVFSAHSWKVGNAANGINASDIDQFEEELDRALDIRRQQGLVHKTILYMYCGSMLHAYLIDNALRKHENVSANVNLFWSSFIDYKAELYVEIWKPFLLDILKNGRVAVTAPTRQFQRGFYEAFGVSLPLAPHPSTTFSDAAARRLSNTPPKKINGDLCVLFPGGMQSAKGFDLSVHAANELASGEKKRRCVVRAYPRPGLSAEMNAARKLLDRERIEVSEDNMSDSEFTRFLARGDIIVLPYRAPQFSQRTSGLLIDALLLGRPAVVLDGTWLAEAVERAHCGVIAQDNAHDLASAVEEAVERYDELSSRAREYRKRYLETNSWEKLVETILTPVGETPVEILPAQPSICFGHRRNAGVQIDETRAVARLLNAKREPEHVMLDVGAHFGTTAGYFDALGWTVHCFEPDPANREKLVARFGETPNVTIDPRAVSDKPAKGLSFFASEESSGISSLHAFRDTHRETARVDATSVAEIVEERSLSRIDFLKIDVEGHDFAVLKGVPWDRIAPDVIECEFEDAKTVPLGHDWRDIAEFLRGKGYTVYVSEWHPIVRYGIPHDWRRLVPYPGVDIDKDAWGNLLAFRNDPGFEAVHRAFRALVKTRAAPAPATSGAKQPPAGKASAADRKAPSGQAATAVNGPAAPANAAALEAPPRADAPAPRNRDRRIAALTARMANVETLVAEMRDLLEKLLRSSEYNSVEYAEASRMVLPANEARGESSKI